MAEERMTGRGEEGHFREGLERLPEQRAHFRYPPALGGQTSLASLSWNRCNRKFLTAGLVRAFSAQTCLCSFYQQEIHVVFGSPVLRSNWTGCLWSLIWWRRSEHTAHDKADALQQPALLSPVNARCVFAGHMATFHKSQCYSFINQNLGPNRTALALRTLMCWKITPLHPFPQRTAAPTPQK